MTSPPLSGELRLEASRRGERTVLSRVYRTVPFHPGPVHYRQGRAEVLLQDVSPGVFPGDRLAIDVTVREGAALTVAGQGATRIYPSPQGIASEVTTSLRVGQGGTLWWLPGEMIPFRDACYAARTEVELAAGARFAFLEIVTPGRVAMGERDRYQRLDLRFRLSVDGKARVIERAVLAPQQGSLALIGSHGEYGYAGLLIAVGYPVPTAVESETDEMWIAADGERDLVIVRGLAHAAAPLREALLALLERMDQERAGLAEEQRPGAARFTAGCAVGEPGPD